MHDSGDVVRGEYDNMEVEAILGNLARKRHNNNSRITQRQWLQQPYQILATNELDWISRIQLFEVYPSTVAYVPGAQGECQKSHKNFLSMKSNTGAMLYMVHTIQLR
jgi:hypothetical protein